MQIIKLIILFVVFLLSNYIGKMIAGKYRFRLEELKEMQSALNMFKTKIRFTYEPIPEVFEEISENSDKSISNIFKNAKEQMDKKTASESWIDAVDSSKNNLTQEDKKTIKILSKMLGESDIEGQISTIDITLKYLEKQLNEAEEEKIKNEKLYQKLGTIMGLAIVIILI